MDTNTKKEEFSYGYLQLLCAINGLALEKTGRAIDNIGIDATITGAGTIRNIYAPRLDVQVKCTSKDIEKEDEIKYELSKKAYDQLRNELTHTKIILIILLVPTDIKDWLIIEEDQLIMKRSGYWICLEGYQETHNSKTISIHIPKENKISNRTILDLIEECSEQRYNEIEMIKNHAQNRPPR